MVAVDLLAGWSGLGWLVALGLALSSRGAPRGVVAAPAAEVTPWTRLGLRTAPLPLFTPGQRGAS